MASTCPSLAALFRTETGPELRKALAQLGDAHVIAPEPVRPLLKAAAPAATLHADVEAVITAHPARAFVIADTFPQETAMRRELRAADIPTAGLYGSMLPSVVAVQGLGALAPPVEQRRVQAAQTADTRYVLFCPARVGSGYLCALLRQAGLGAPYEHVREAAAAAAAAGMPLTTFLQALEPYAARNGVFATKVITIAFAKACGGKLERSRDTLRRMLERGYTTFGLTRDPLDAVVSRLMAETTNLWHVERQGLEEARAAQADAAMRDGPFLNLLFSRVAQDVFAEKVFDIPRGQCFRFEDLKRDPTAIVRRIGDQIGRPASETIEAEGLPVELGQDNPAYQRWRRRACELVLAHAAKALPRILAHGRELTGLSPDELKSWPEFESHLTAVFRAAQERLDTVEEPAS